MKKVFLLFSLMLISTLSFSQGYHVTANGVKGYTKVNDKYVEAGEKKATYDIYFDSNIVVLSINGKIVEYPVISTHKSKSGEIHLVVYDADTNGKCGKEFIFIPNSNQFFYIDKSNGVIIKFIGSLILKRHHSSHYDFWKI
jgi:hypothetical protein